MAKQLARKLIRTDGGTQVRVELDQETFLEYGRQMAAGVKFPPLDVFYDGATYWLADGFHRFYGARESGIESVDVRVHNGTVRDAILFAIGANAAHGKPRTNKDKRHAVEMLLADEKWSEWSAEKIADVAAVGHSLVHDVMKQLSESESWTPPETTLGKDGKRRRKPKPRKPKISTPTFIDDEEHHPVADDDANDDQDASGGAEPVSSGPLAGMEPDSAGVVSKPRTEPPSGDKEACTDDAAEDSEPSACDRYRQRLVEWTRKQFDNIDGLTWGHAMSVWFQLSEMSADELDNL